MLILVFRGIFLIGILSWYSTNVWKMIDGYFKDQFEKYLQREYEKNPKMKDDVTAYATRNNEEDNKRTTRREKAKDPQDYFDKGDFCETMDVSGEKTCPVDSRRRTGRVRAAGVPTGSGSLLSRINLKDTDVDASESEVRGKPEAAVDKNGFSEISPSVSSITENPRQLPASEDNAVEYVEDEEPGKSALNGIAIEKVDEKNSTSKTTIKDVERNKNASSKATGVLRPNIKADVDENTIQKREKRRLSEKRNFQGFAGAASKNYERGKKNMKKFRVKTIILTEEDFRQAKARGRLRDYDFSEFDDRDDDETSDQRPEEGILVSQLPFKPRADIANLERVTDEEFCPLTLEDEVNCGETKTWP